MIMMFYNISIYVLNIVLIIIIIIIVIVIITILCIAYFHLGFLINIVDVIVKTEDYFISYIVDISRKKKDLLSLNILAFC